MRFKRTILAIPLFVLASLQFAWLAHWYVDQNSAYWERQRFGQFAFDLANPNKKSAMAFAKQVRKLVNEKDPNYEQNWMVLINLNSKVNQLLQNEWDNKEFQDIYSWYVQSKWEPNQELVRKARNNIHIKRWGLLRAYAEALSENSDNPQVDFLLSPVSLWAKDGSTSSVRNAMYAWMLKDVNQFFWDSVISHESSAGKLNSCAIMVIPNAHGNTDFEEKISSSGTFGTDLGSWMIGQKEWFWKDPSAPASLDGLPNNIERNVKYPVEYHNIPNPSDPENVMSWMGEFRTLWKLMKTSNGYSFLWVLSTHWLDVGNWKKIDEEFRIIANCR